jgi:hypothetical protein
MRADHHQCAKVPPIPEVVERARSVPPTCSTTGILTSRKVTIRHQLVELSSSSDDDLPLVNHDTRVDLNPDGVRIRYI